MNCMEGYGLYVYPDGSEYQGFFRRGRFHGYGRLTMAAPYAFTFIGEFHNGELAIINEMIYPDGLIFNADFKNGKLNTDNWPYLSKTDRRYTRELCLDLTPVVPEEPIARYGARSLKPKCYDTEEGVFVEKSRFITQIPPPFYHLRFVNCDKELEWIQKYCRHEDTDNPYEPDEASGREIIETNIKATTELGENLYSCTCNVSKPDGLEKLCRRGFREGDVSSSTSAFSNGYRELSSSSSASSFITKPLKRDLKLMCDNEVAQLGLKPNDLGSGFWV